MQIYIYSILSLILIGIVFMFLKSHSRLKEIKLDLGLGAIIYGGLIAIYSLILAFVVIVVWQQYQVTGDRIETEASKLFNVYRSTFAFKDNVNKPFADTIRDQIKCYVTSIQDDEWKLMAFNSSSKKTQAINNKIVHGINQLEPVTEAEKVWYGAMVHDLSQFSEARHSRLANRDYSIPTIMWIMLIAGGAVIIIFSMLLEGKTMQQHLLKVLMISVMIICCMMLVYLLDHPFNEGAFKLQPTAFQKIFVGNW